MKGRFIKIYVLTHFTVPYLKCIWHEKSFLLSVHFKWPGIWAEVRDGFVMIQTKSTLSSAGKAVFSWVSVVVPICFLTGFGITTLSNMGYWSSVRSRLLDIGQVLFFAHLWMSTPSHKRERGQYPAVLTEQAWSTQWVLPSRQDSAILPARVANYSTGFGSSCPLTELAKL